MKVKKIISYAVLLAFALVLACSDDDVRPGNVKTNNVSLVFNNRAGSQDMALGTALYTNAFGEALTVTTFNYFISNVVLKKTDGTEVAFPEEYFLIRQADPQTWTQTLPKVPSADYDEISFTIGVDSARSASNISSRTGVLDPASYGDDGMYWSWNSGYIFVKMEGTSPVVPLNSAGKREFQLHIGGYGGRDSKAPNNLRRVTLPFNQRASVRTTIAPSVHISADFLKVFSGPNPVRLAETNRVHNPAGAGPIADNYMKMFRVERITNP